MHNFVALWHCNVVIKSDEVIGSSSVDNVPAGS